MAVLEVQYRWTFNGVTQQNVHYAVGDTLDSSDLQAFADFIDAIYDNRLQSFFGTGWTSIDPIGRVVSTQGNPYIPLPTTPFSGTGNLEELPLGATLLVQFYRSAPAPNRKRVYLSGFTVGNLANGVPANGLVAAAQLWADDLRDLTLLNAKTASYAVGRYTGTPAYMPTAFQLTNYTVSTTFGHMESRET